MAERSFTSGHPSHPLSEAELRGKIDALLQPLFGDGFGERLWLACQKLIDSTDHAAVDALFDILTTPPNEQPEAHNNQPKQAQ